MEKPKTINSLMAYLRNDKGININGSIQKKKLRFMGYFHGYKGYRYYNSPSSLFSYKDFNELQSVYDFDMNLKALIYPRIMLLETTLKNFVLECVLKESQSERFVDIFSSSLTSYKTYSVGNSKYTKEMKRRLRFRENMYNTISRDYKRSLVKHYYDKDQPVPIWAIFELLSLGEFGNFFLCLDKKIKLDISKTVGIKSSVDADGEMTGIVIFTLKDLRNAIAHNGTIFDTRFKTEKINNRIMAYIENELGTNNINYNSIVDYIILIAFLMKILGYSKREILSFINEFEKICETFRKQVSASIYMKILYSDTRNKLNLLKKYCKKA